MNSINPEALQTSCPSYVPEHILYRTPSAPVYPVWEWRPLTMLVTCCVYSTPTAKTCRSTWQASSTPRMHTSSWESCGNCWSVPKTTSAGYRLDSSSRRKRRLRRDRYKGFLLWQTLQKEQSKSCLNVCCIRHISLFSILEIALTCILFFIKFIFYFVAHLQSPGWQSTCSLRMAWYLIWWYVSIEKSMVIHDTKCLYWEQAGTTQTLATYTNPFPLKRKTLFKQPILSRHEKIYHSYHNLVFIIISDGSAKFCNTKYLLLRLVLMNNISLYIFSFRTSQPTSQTFIHTEE